MKGGRTVRSALDISLKNLKWVNTIKKRMSAALTLLSLVVILNVFWLLRQPGLTLAGDASCGIQEHAHDEECGSRTLACEILEEPHQHDESCYEILWVRESEEQVLICDLTEEPHIHTDECYEEILSQRAEASLTCQVQEEDHTHGDDCYEWAIVEVCEDRVLICDLVSQPHEHGDACYTTETVQAHEEWLLRCDPEEKTHTHDDSCYEWDLTCELTAHVHTLSCYTDVTADVETMLDWQEMFANYPFTGHLREDLVGIAKSQVGYCESTLNFEVGNDGIRRGYTRYGAWYGTPYRDWSALFVSFCLNYAGADPEEIPGNTGAASMAELWNKLMKFAPVGEYTPVSGDLVFFRDNTVGIVAEVQSVTFQVIRGDIDDAVETKLLPLTDESISGWGLTEGTILSSGQPEEETVPEETWEPVDVDEEILDISDGPAFFIFEGGETATLQRGYFRASPRSIIELIPYLDENGGSYFFTLLDMNNVELPKDENGNYIAKAHEGYKLTITVNSPEGFLPGTYQYQIPNGLMVDGGTGSFTLKDGTNVGSWEVTDTGLITLFFNDHINSRADITISATMGIHFPEQSDPIDFDGKITVSVEPPAPQVNPTVVNKWGNQGGTPGSAGTDESKIYWGIEVIGNLDSQIPGSILTDKVIDGEWSKPHRFTDSDIAAGLSFGVSENGNWHNWVVTADDPHLIWTEDGWTYKMPKTAVCQWCGEIELGNAGWYYYINYTSTPLPAGMGGTFGYENEANIDGAYGYAWVNFTQGEVTGEIDKTGAFMADAGGGRFVWEFKANIPGRQEGKKADYHWYIMDTMKVLDENWQQIGLVENTSHLSTVTTTYNGVTITVPRIQDATANDLFAWDNGWTASSNGVNHGREFSLLMRCQCTPETCHWGGSCGEYWYQKDDGTYATNGFCQCWTTTEYMTFTFVYETTDVAVIEQYGGFDNRLHNLAELFYIPEGNTGGASVDRDEALVTIPGLFRKELTQDFNGYTAHYNVTVNEAKLVLTDGSPLYINDVMTNTLAYISGSLVIRTEDLDGNRSTLKQDVDFTVTYDGTGNQTDENGREVHVLDIVILHPQPVMYILDYDATLIIPDQVSSGVRYSNSASITLWGEKITQDTVEKVHADINIASKSYEVHMYKTCASTGLPLGGATFGIYNEYSRLITSEVTDDDGTLSFHTNVTEGIILRDHVRYYLQELQAPPGYRLDDKKYWFCFCDNEADSCKTCEQLLPEEDAFRVPFQRIGKVHVTNELMIYDLPATGGSGTYPLILVSVTFIVIPLVYGLIQLRRRERRAAE